MDQPKFWKQLKRHPLSAEYGDITGNPWDAFVANLKKIGNPTAREILIHDGMILDGWQFQRAHVQIDRRPRYRELPPDITAEEYVETLQDHRRHDSADAIARRVDARRERVGTARAAGESTRVIADNEGVSDKTIRNDISILTAEGSAVNAPDGVIIGKDGGKRKAKADPNKPKTPRGNKTHSPAKASEEADVKDDNDESVCECARSAFVDAASFKKANDLLSQAADIISKTITSDAGHYLKGRTAHFETAINNVKSQWLAGRPDYNCPYCVDAKREPKANCSCCKGCGWVPKHVYESSPKAKKAKGK